MGSVRKEGFPKPHPYTVVEGTFVYDGPPTESDLSFLPSGRLPVSATGYVKERFQLQNGAVRLRLRIEDPQTRRILQEHGIFGDPWVELTPKDSRTGRRKWRGGNYSESHEVKLNENALEQGSLWG